MEREECHVPRLGLPASQLSLPTDVLVAHDTRNALTAALGRVELAERSLRRDPVTVELALMSLEIVAAQLWRVGALLDVLEANRSDDRDENRLDCRWSRNGGTFPNLIRVPGSEAGGPRSKDVVARAYRELATLRAHADMALAQVRSAERSAAHARKLQEHTLRRLAERSLAGSIGSRSAARIDQQTH
jgi:hypothetical protein